MAARDAVNPDAYVAGGISPERVLGQEFTDRARLLADGGADLILAENVPSLAKNAPSVSDCVRVAQACAEIDLPLFVSVGLDRDGNLFDGTPVEALATALQAHHVACLLVQCTFAPWISNALPRLRDSFSGFVGALPHGGPTDPEDPRWADEPRFDPDAPYYTPEMLAEYAQTWKEIGA